MKKLILFAEDNPDISLCLKMTLEFNGYEVIATANGVEALDAMHRSIRTPDLIISDVRMPQMDGYTFFTEVSKVNEWNRIPFLFLTARTSPEDLRLSRILGVEDFMFKPFKEEELLDFVADRIAWDKSINEKIQQGTSELQQTPLDDNCPSIEKQVSLITLTWDQDNGTQVLQQSPATSSPNCLLEKFSTSLITSIMTDDVITKLDRPYGILFGLGNTGLTGYAYLDYIKDESVSSNRKWIMFMMGAPKITYFESLSVKEVFKTIKEIVVKGAAWDITDVRMKINDTLSLTVTPTIPSI